LSNSDDLISARNIYMHFSSVPVLQDINVSFQKAKIYGVVGENGAGKTTLMRILSGFLQPTNGEIFVEGVKVTLNPVKAKSLGIIMVPQELNLVDTLKVYENVFLGDELTRNFFLKKRDMIESTKHYLEKFGLSIDPTLYVSELSPAQKQMVEIIKAISKKAKILIMDEPTSSLTEDEVKKLFEVIYNMRRLGISVVFISHRLKEIMSITDWTIVLRDGRKVHEGETKELTEKQIAELMIGRNLDDIYPQKIVPENNVVFEVRNLTSKDNSIKNVSFKVFKNEILGFYGLVGSGRTELMQTILGIKKLKSGEISLNGIPISISSVMEAKKLGILYLPEDRKAAGIILTLEVFKNCTLMSLEKFSRFLLNNRLEISTFKHFQEKFDIKVKTPYQIAKTLSGGNQQKVVISKLVNAGARIFIFDEPTRGVDVNAKSQIYQIMSTLLKDMDATFLVVSSELSEIIGLCNRVIVMRGGEIAGVAIGSDINEKYLIYLATGLEEVNYSSG